jgi:hypothetical protein
VDYACFADSAGNNVPGMSEAQPPVLVTEHTLMWGDGPAVRMTLRRLRHGMIRTLGISFAAFAAPALYAHCSWYIERSGG